MKLKLNDNTELNVKVINGTTRNYQNATRDSLEFVFEKDAYPFDVLERHFADQNKTCKMTIIEEVDGVTVSEYLHEGYILRVSMSLNPVIVTPATATTQEITEERISVIMAQETYIEHQLAQLNL